MTTASRTHWTKAVLNLIAPRYCAMCGCRLTENDDEPLCSACTMNLPYTRFEARRGNPLELLLHGRFAFERATAYLYYERDANARNLLFSMKYYDRPWVATAMGRRMAVALGETGFFDDIDCLVPVPLARRRLRQRGYNQSERLASGLAQITGLPVEQKVVVRRVNNPSQTSRLPALRADNVSGIFALRHPERLAGRHALLVDDVITTGATIASCATTLLAAPQLKLSVLALAVSAAIKHT